MRLERGRYGGWVEIALKGGRGTGGKQNPHDLKAHRGWRKKDDPDGYGGGGGGGGRRGAGQQDQRNKT